MAKINSEWERKPTTHKENCYMCEEDIIKGEMRLRNKLNFASINGSSSVCSECISDMSEDKFERICSGDNCNAKLSDMSEGNYCEECI